MHISFQQVVSQKKVLAQKIINETLEVSLREYMDQVMLNINNLQPHEGTQLKELAINESRMILRDEIANVFSVDELEQILRFFSSPAGKKYLHESPNMAIRAIPKIAEKLDHFIAKNGVV